MKCRECGAALEQVGKQWRAKTGPWRSHCPKTGGTHVPVAP